jgi:RNA polymerase sigma factor (sigma-70 family)
MKYVYTTATGEIEIEVDQHFYDILTAMDKEERSADRRHNRHKAFSLDGGDYGRPFCSDGTDLLDELIQRETEERINMAIEELPPDQRTLIERVLFREEKIADISQEYGIPESTIRSRFKQSCRQLKKILD